MSETFVPDVELALQAVPTKAQIFAGQPTEVWRYQGQVLKGDPATLAELPGSYLGPIIHARQGQKMRIHFTNNLSEKSIVHWHGLRVPDSADGHPRFAVGTGETYTYDFEVLNRAGTYWFHPHPHGRTGSQVYRGLAGLFLVSDSETDRLALPDGDFDLPLVIQDRIFDANNQLVYAAGAMPEQMMGFLGDQILVNGKPDYGLSVSTRPYRLRLLNGSNSRIYKLAWNDRTPLMVIGTDGGLLETPVRREYVMLAPAERLELWADFSHYPVGTELVLQSLPFAGQEVGGMGRGMMGRGMMGSSATLEQGAGFPVLSVRVERSETAALTLPDRLSTISRYDPAEAINANSARDFSLAMQHMIWTINGRTFQMSEVAANEIVRLGTLELWELINETSTRGMMGGGMGMQLPHPIHIHGLQFQILNRQVSSTLADTWQTVSGGFVDEGWKDTVLLMPGERVSVLLKFEDYTGLYLYHCHNLEHEDMGMMRNYEIRA